MEGAASTHRHPLLGDQNLGKTVTIEEIVSKIEESRLQAADAAVHAASAVSHCQAVWNQLEMQKISDDEANIVSSAASIAAAACIAKVAVAAAKIASNVAEQARSMANEVFQSRFNVKGIRSSEGDTPHGKRRKFGSRTEKEASSDVDLRRGFQKERSGKKQKFMDGSKHYVADGNVKPSDSGKLPLPRAQVHRELKNNSKNDVKKEKQIKPKLHKSRKPPIPRIHGNRTSNKEDAPCSSSDNLKEVVPQRLNKRKFTPGGGKPPKVEVKNKSSTSEAEPRRSNRKIQPTYHKGFAQCFLYSY